MREQKSNYVRGLQMSHYQVYKLIWNASKYTWCTYQCRARLGDAKIDVRSEWWDKPMLLQYWVYG